jgi:hypothetical protein
MSGKLAATYSAPTSPWRGEVGLRSRPGGGEIFIFPDHPTPPLASLAATLPLQGRVKTTDATP